MTTAAVNEGDMSKIRQDVLYATITAALLESPW